MATVRVTSVVPSRYCAPDRPAAASRARASLGQPLGRPVVHDGAVRGGAGDGVEATGPSARRWLRGSLPACRPRRARWAASGPPRSTTQCRNLASAVPSRICAERAPSISTAFLLARGRAVGSGPRTTFAPAFSSASKYQADEVAGSTSTRWPERSPSAPASRSGGSSVTPLPSQAGSSGVTLAGSRNSRAEPSAFSIACDSGSGERITSPPRMLKSQALEAGAVISAASAPRSARLLPTRSRLAVESSPENSPGCGCDRRLRLGRPRRAPGGIERIGLDRLQRRAGLGRGRAQALQRLGAVQLGIVADGPARLGLGSAGRPARRPRPGRAPRRGRCPPGRAPAGRSGRRRRCAALSFKITAAPAEPVKPVAQASRSLAAGRYSFWCSSSCGITKPSRPCAAMAARISGACSRPKAGVVVSSKVWRMPPI